MSTLSDLEDLTDAIVARLHMLARVLPHRGRVEHPNRTTEAAVKFAWNHMLGVGTSLIACRSVALNSRVQHGRCSMNASRPILLSFVGLFLIVLTGCSQDQAMEPSRPVLSIQPADGAAGVRLDTSVLLQFGVPVDRDVIERSFHLLRESSMNDSLCSGDPSVPGDMAEMMEDGAMMEHMLQSHAASGSFQWNGNTECSFQPDALMEPSTRYMIHMGREAMEMMSGMSMAGHRGMQGEMNMHFTTVDATGHESHHAADLPSRR